MPVKLSRDLMRFYVIPAVLVLGVLLTAGFTAFYTATARTREGRIISGRWPMELTLSFAQHLSRANGAVTVSEEGLALLESNGLWLQVLDENGAELLSYRKPAAAPDAYRPYELLLLYQNGLAGESVFVSAAELDGVSCPYLIGFPLSLSKAVLYVDNARYRWGRALALGTMLATFILLVGLTVFYNAAVSKGLDGIRRSLRAVADRSYVPVGKRRFLRDLYDGIDLLNKDLLAADARRERDDKAREEWLANVAHDLKTPLAPIRGYGELLSEEDGPSPENVRRYGAVIVKNALYAEQLVDDLKLTYQLQSGMLPLHPRKENVTRFVRELVIDLLNAPEYAGRAVFFASADEERICAFDARLLRRALDNVLLNALKHNPPNTAISVAVGGAACTEIVIADNGEGMTPKALEGLFTRYYRGPEAKAGGTGLGMAIARQIAEAHGGSLCADSAPGAGTTVTLRLP